LDIFAKNNTTAIQKSVDAEGNKLRATASTAASASASASAATPLQKQQQAAQEQHEQPRPPTPLDATSYYDALGVAFDATDQEIKRAYHSTSRQWHPDKNHSSQLHTKVFQRLLWRLMDVCETVIISAGSTTPRC